MTFFREAACNAREQREDQEIMPELPKKGSA